MMFPIGQLLIKSCKALFTTVISVCAEVAVRDASDGGGDSSAFRVVVTGPNDTDRAGGVLGGGPSGTLVPPGVYTLPMLVPTRGVRGVSGSFCTKGLPTKAFGDNRSINGMLSGTRSPGGFIGTGSRSNKLSGSALTNLPLP